MTNKTPIILHAYNRPKYFERVVKSVHEQVVGRDVYCFIDGPKHSQDDAPILENVRLCKKYLPNATIFIEPTNIGICRIAPKALDMLFEENEFLIILEDDSVLAPHYIKQLDRLIEFFYSDTRVGLINCYGETCKTSDTNKSDFCPMGHLWAYAFRRTSWIAIQDVVKEYLRVLEHHWSPVKRGYTSNVNQALMNLWNILGFKSTSTTQDSCFQSATILHGIICISTQTNNLEYIGVEGEYCSKEYFYSKGFADWPVYTEYQHNFNFDESVFNDIKSKLEKAYLYEKR